MIADALTHVTPDGRWFSTGHDASVDRLRRELDESGVDAAVVVALADHIPNDFVLRVCSEDSRLIPGCSFNPLRIEPRAFRAAVAGSPFRVLKLHPGLNGFDPLDPACLALLEELASFAEPIPVWLCSWFATAGLTLRRGPVETACELADRFPTLQFVFLHAGGPLALPLAHALRPRRNTFIDLSNTLVTYAGSSVSLDIRWLLEHFDRRTLFGSDFPEHGLGASLTELRAVGQDVSAEKMANVMGGNLARLLGLDHG